MVLSTTRSVQRRASVKTDVVENARRGFVRTRESPTRPPGSASAPSIVELWVSTAGQTDILPSPRLNSLLYLALAPGGVKARRHNLAS